jgi:hypothetical protein
MNKVKFKVMYVRGGDFQTRDSNPQFYQRLLTFMMIQELYEVGQ